MGIRKSAAQLVSAVSTGVLKHVFRRPAENFPGKVALYVDPQIIAHMAPKLARGSVCVVGTNGKTTITNMVADCIEAAGLRAVCNRGGANLDSGVATSLLHAQQSDWGVFECDELWLAKCLPQLQSRFVVLTNLFRDQLDRIGEVDRIQESIAGALAASPETVLVYNADDPNCERIARMVPNPRVPFGIGEALGAGAAAGAGGAGELAGAAAGAAAGAGELAGAAAGAAVGAGAAGSAVAEAAHLCQECGHVLAYDYRSYDQLGRYACSHCSFARSPLRFSARGCSIDGTGLAFDVFAAVGEAAVGGGRIAHVQAPYTGTYMIYNLLAVYVAGHLMGLPDEAVFAAMAAYDPHNGRLETLQVQGKQVVLNLAKNPTGFNENLGLLSRDASLKAAAFYVNDKEGDGRDVSWIWDIDFEQLAGQDLAAVFVGGMRANDLQVRLKYAGLDAQVVQSAAEVMDAVRSLPSSCHVYHIANYTSLPVVRAEMVKLMEAEVAGGAGGGAGVGAGGRGGSAAAGSYATVPRDAGAAAAAAGADAAAGVAAGSEADAAAGAADAVAAAAGAAAPGAAAGEGLSAAREPWTRALPQKPWTRALPQEPWAEALAQRPVRIVALCGEMLNLSGDSGNLRILAKRCAWRGIPVRVENVPVGSACSFADADIVFVGSGPDREQRLACESLAASAQDLKTYVEDGGVLLAVGSGFHLLGTSWAAGAECEAGLGVLDMETRAEAGDGASGSAERVVGDAVLRCSLSDDVLIGYQNHIGRSYLASGLQPLGQVDGKVGAGNNAQGPGEGVLYRNAVGTTLHGPVLAKAPELADWLIARAIERRAGAGVAVELPALDDAAERAANAFMRSRLGV